MTFGFQLKQLRLKSNLTQTQLAQKVNLSKANISKYESDSIQPSLETLTKIANIFSVSVDYLLGNDDIKETQNETPLSPQKKELLDAASNLSDDDIKKVVEYTEFIKQKGNQK